MSTNEMSPSLAAAFERYQQGDHIGAENILIQSIEETAAEFGLGSYRYAQANYELGSLLTVLGRHVDAANALKVACSVSIPDDLAATKDRLTYMMQLGELYNQMQDLDEAERILREGLHLRAEFYGIDHPGYGFGLEPLSSVLMNQGRLSEALEAIETTIDNFWMNGHPRVSSAFPLRALILSKLEQDTSPFKDLEDLPESLVLEMIDAAIRLSETDDHLHLQNMLGDLLRMVEERLGDRDNAVTKLRTALVNVTDSIGQSEGRLEAIEKVVAAHLSNGNLPPAVHALIGLAIAQGELGNPTTAEESYRTALHHAEDLGDFSLQSQCLRNLGLFYSEQDRKSDAVNTLRLAVMTGQKSSDKEMLGRSLAALGIFLQHEGNLAEASQCLQQALKLLDTSHPDSVCCRSHLSAIENDQSCGCGDMSGALCQAFREQILNNVPDGLLQDVSVSLGENGFNVSVDVAKELNEGEMDVLNRNIQQTEIDFRNRIQEP